MSQNFDRKGYPYIVIMILQIISIILYGVLVEYDETASPILNKDPNKLGKYYGMFQDVHVMIFIGFGFLMTFLSKYFWSSISFNFFISAFVIQWSVLINGFFHNALDKKENFSHKIKISIKTLVVGDFAAGAVLITFGALLGKVTFIELTVIGFCEVLFFSLNESIGVIKLKAIDMGGSMFVHTFGAYFGIACSIFLTNKEKLEKSEQPTNEVSDIFSMIGTIFLWLFWPSFNGVLAEGESQHRVVINTVYALVSSCIFSFIFSGLLREKGKFSMADIQNATLAGGVAVGTSSDLIIKPFGALVIGAIGGFISVFGYSKIQSWLEKKGIHDTCGVNNLHGMPGIIGALAGAFAVYTVDYTYYPDPNRTSGTQCGFQILTLITTLFLSIIGGSLTGLLIKFFNKKFVDSSYYDKDVYFSDSTQFEEIEEVYENIGSGDAIHSVEFQRSQLDNEEKKNAEKLNSNQVISEIPFDNNQN